MKEMTKMEIGDIGEERNRSFAIYQHKYIEASKMLDGKWYDSPAFYVQGSAWKIGAKIRTENGVKYLGLYIRRYRTPDNYYFRFQEYYAEVEMKLIGQSCDAVSLMRVYQQMFNGGRKANYGWPKFKLWAEVLLAKNGYIKNDSFLVEVFLAAAPPVINISKNNKITLKKSQLFSDMNVSAMAAESESSMELQKINSFQGICVTGSVLQERAQSVLESGLGSDCEFLVGKHKNEMKSFKVSQLFLARASPIFEKLFFGESDGKTFFELSDVDPDAFWTMLQYAYNCSWRFKSDEHAMNLYYVAHKYCIRELQEQCVSQLWPTDISNVWNALNLASQFCEETLMASAMKIICDNTVSAFHHPDFVHISHTSLIAILEQSYLDVDTELDIFMAAKNWAIAKCKQKGLSEDGNHLREELGNALKYIRFLTLSPQQFIGRPMESGILSADESVILLRCINNKEKFLPSPYLSALRKPRRKQCN